VAALAFRLVANQSQAARARGLLTHVGAGDADVTCKRHGSPHNAVARDGDGSSHAAAGGLFKGKAV